MRRRTLALVAAGLALSGCSFVRSLGAPADLFADAAEAERFDFEADSPSQAPSGLEARLGSWAVADSPTAPSGHQVLVRTGDAIGVIEVKSTEGARQVRGEVDVRIYVGASGAGIGCDDGAAGYVWKVEPAGHRVALYRRTGDALRELVKHPAAVQKGDWAKLGIRCDPDRVVGYLDGKPAASEPVTVGKVGVTLYADAGVTAQFDDLRVGVRK